MATRLGPRGVRSGLLVWAEGGLEAHGVGLYLCGAVSLPPLLPSLEVPGGPRFFLVWKRAACLGAVCNTKTLLEFEWKPVGCRLMGGLVCRKAGNQRCTCGCRMRRMLLDPLGGPASRQPQWTGGSQGAWRSWVMVPKRPLRTSISYVASWASDCSLLASCSSPRCLGPAECRGLAVRCSSEGLSSGP